MLAAGMARKVRQPVASASAMSAVENFRGVSAAPFVPALSVHAVFIVGNRNQINCAIDLLDFTEAGDAAIVSPVFRPSAQAQQ